MPIARPEAPELISLVVPVLDEEDTVGTFIGAAHRFAINSSVRVEAVFVDDGSRDGTREAIVAAAMALPDAGLSVRLVALSKNFGKEAALTAGLAHAVGDAVVPIDVDLQDPVEVIETFIDRWREGHDVVYGVRENRDADSRLKRYTSSVFYRVFNKLSRDPIPENVGDFRLMDRRVVEAVLSMPEKNRFMKGIFSWVGFSSCSVGYRRNERSAGTTKWNYWKLWNFALDGLIGFSSIPLRIWTYAGIAISLLSFAYGGTIVFRKLVFGIAVEGWASLMVAVVFFGGVQLISLGVIGEYLGRIFVESKNRPIFLVDTVSDVTASQPHVRTNAETARPEIGSRLATYDTDR